MNRNDDPFVHTCECNTHCALNVKITVGEAMRVVTSGLYLIVDGCPSGPKSTDVFVEKGKGYKLYRQEGKNG